MTRIRPCGLLLLAALLVVPFFAAATPALAHAGAMRLDRASIHRFSVTPGFIVDAAGGTASAPCFVGRTSVLGTKLAFSCDPTMRVVRQLMPWAYQHYLNSIAVTPTTAIVGGCSRARSALEHVPFVLRLTHDGAYDTSFAATGNVTIAVPGYASACIRAVDVLDDGRVVVMGTATEHGVKQGVDVPETTWLARLAADGSIDHAFGADGFTIIRAPLMKSTIGHDAAVLADGSTLTVGSVYPSSGGGIAASFLLDGDGHAVSTYGSNGIAVHPTGTGTAALSAIARRLDGRPALPVAVSGSFNRDGLVRPMVLRIGADGARIAGRGTGVTVQLPVTSYAGDDGIQIFPMVEAADGRLTIAGERPTPIDYDSFVTRLSGTDDFDTTGPFAGAEPFDTTHGKDDEYVLALLPGTGAPLAVGVTKVAPYFVGQAFTASQPSPRSMRYAAMRLHRAGGPVDAVARCGLTQRTACRVHAANVELVGVESPRHGPADIDADSGVVASLGQLQSNGVGAIWELPMRLVRGRGGWTWILNRHMPRGQYLVTMRRNAGRRAGAMESDWLWVNVS